MLARPPPPHWDVFCRVVDNLGDAGIAWRLARQLVREHGVRTTLWIDAPQVLAGMTGSAAIADGTCIAGVTIRSMTACDASAPLPAVIVEVLGCGLPERYREAVRAAPVPPQWFILEYLSAEAWVAGMHAKPSPDPASGIARRFWFPGFTPDTGGLLRERELGTRRNTFAADPTARAARWRALGVGALAPDAMLVSLFCYAHAPVLAAFAAWSAGARPVACMVPEGVASAAIARWCEGRAPTIGQSHVRGALTLHAVPFVPQDDYDELLWACDFNFVRGEDSFVRAQWAGRPFAWHIYPQEAAAHHVKLAAFLDAYAVRLDPGAAEALRAFWGAWNGLADAATLAPAWDRLVGEFGALRTHARAWADALATLPELTQTLVEAAADKV